METIPIEYIKAFEIKLYRKDGSVLINSPAYIDMGTGAIVTVNPGYIEIRNKKINVTLVLPNRMHLTLY